MPTVTLTGRRILVDGRPDLVLAGEVHYFRLDPGVWAERLRQLRDAGGDTVATYVPWLWHELPDRTVDLTGRTDPRRDLAGFLDLAHANGFRAIVRPGPFIMAEIKNEGVPYRLYDDTPELVPVTWDGASVPTRTLDYLAPAFLDAAGGWYDAVLPVIAARLAPRGGPVIAVQLDNEIGMLSWVTNAPDLTDVVCADIRRWAGERYGTDGRFGLPADDPDAWAAALRHPPADRSLLIHDALGRYSRDRYRRYVEFLRSRAASHGVDTVPLLINVHGTMDRRGRTFPIGISQLFEAYRGVPGMTSGSDLYLGDLTVTNAPDLYVANAFLAAAHDADQPLTSLEFEAGNGDYDEDLSIRYPPEAVELKARMCVAQGNRLLNLYLFAGGHNPRLERPVGDGNDRIAFTGERHGFAAPVGPEGRLNATYGSVRSAFTAIRAAAGILADSAEEDDGFALGFVPDHYLTEYRHPASDARRAQVDDLERFRGMGPRDVLARGLLLAGFSFPAVDLQAPDTALPRALVLGSPATLGRDVQDRLAAYVRAGGRLLLHGVLPDRDVDGMPCTVLADALGLRAAGRVDATTRYFPSVVTDGAEVRVGYAQLIDGGSPLMAVVGLDASCAVEATAGAGSAIVLAADYPCHLDFWRGLMTRLGVEPRLAHDAIEPGLIVTSTVDRAGQRLLHLLNVGPAATEFALSYRGVPVLNGRRLRLAARAGVMLPYGVRIGPATLLETTCELAGIDGGTVTLRPTQGGGDVAVFDREPTTVDGGIADGRTVLARAYEPVRVDFT